MKVVGNTELKDGDDNDLDFPSNINIETVTNGYIVSIFYQNEDFNSVEVYTDSDKMFNRLRKLA